MAAAILRSCPAHRAGLLGKGRIHPPESGTPRVGGQTRRLDLVERRGILWSLPGRAETPLLPGDPPGTTTSGGQDPHLISEGWTRVRTPRAADPKAGSALLRLCSVRFLMKPSTLRFGAPKQAGKSRGTLRRRYTERVR